MSTDGVVLSRTIQPSSRFGLGVLVAQSMRPGNESVMWVSPTYEFWRLPALRPTSRNCTPPPIATLVWLTTGSSSHATVAMPPEPAPG
jgi:hypothetical protein